MGIRNYCNKQYITVFISEVLFRSGSVSSTGRIGGQEISVIESVFSNIPGCKLYTWIKKVSTTHLFKKFSNNYILRHFRITISTIWPDQFFACFCKAPCLLCCIWFSLLRTRLRFFTPLYKVYLTNNNNHLVSCLYEH